MFREYICIYIYICKYTYIYIYIKESYVDDGVRGNQLSMCNAVRTAERVMAVAMSMLTSCHSFYEHGSLMRCSLGECSTCQDSDMTRNVKATSLLRHLQFAFACLLLQVPTVQTSLTMAFSASNKVLHEHLFKICSPERMFTCVRVCVCACVCVCVCVCACVPVYDYECGC